MSSSEQDILRSERLLHYNQDLVVTLKHEGEGLGRQVRGEGLGKQVRGGCNVFSVSCYALLEPCCVCNYIRIIHCT